MLVPKLMGRFGVFRMVGLAALTWSLNTGCPADDPLAMHKSPDSGIVTYVYDDTEDDKSRVFPLVGRWYPVDEVRRLSDRSLTAEEWCARPPSRILIEIGHARVQCAEGAEHAASIAEVTTSTVPGTFIVSFRTMKTAPLRKLTFNNVKGIGAQISHSPCFPGKAVTYQRFPEFEVLKRKIIAGRPCSMVTGAGALP